MDVTIYYGVSGIRDDARAVIRTVLEKNGCFIVDEVTREIKSGIDSLVEKYSKPHQLVLILSRNLESRNPFTIDDMIRYQKLLPSIKIILIVENAEKGKAYLREMSSNGLYLALYSEDTNPNRIADLVVNGRTVVEAREYYGIELRVQSKTLTLDAALAHIQQTASDPQEYVERAIWVKNAMGSEELFREVIRRLPNDIKDVLADDALCAPYLKEYIMGLEQKEQKERKESEKSEVENTVAVGYVKDAVSRAVRRTVIGVAGCQEHIGCTHQSLIVAHSLSSQGYRVAVVENRRQQRKVFSCIAEAAGKEDAEWFAYKGVDYYPDFSLSQLHTLSTKAYNFVVIDFGLFNSDIIEEYGRCALQIIVSGSREWELVQMDRVFDLVEEEQLKTYNYLFISTPEHMKRKIKREMGILSNVFFADYEPNSYSGEGYPALQQILNDYIVDVPVKKGLFGKVRGILS